MNIVILGAGAIGSLFGALLSKKNDVLLIGRTPHINTIKKHGLKITGKTKTTVKIPAIDSIKQVTFLPDVIILTVKSYDTEIAIKQAKPIIGKDTIVLSLQNGLDNIGKIKQNVDQRQITAGVTTHGSFFSKPGCITHTGLGQTILGELNGEKTECIKKINSVFNEAGIDTTISTDIVKEIWVKAIVNSCINPLTTFFQCKNGYLLENPVLENMVDKICNESTMVAKNEGVDLSYQNILEKTKFVIRDTGENYSSMLQSFKRGKKTEIDSINGKLIDAGKIYGLDMSLNKILIHLVKSMNK